MTPSNRCICIDNCDKGEGYENGKRDASLLIGGILGMKTPVPSDWDLDKALRELASRLRVSPGSTADEWDAASRYLSEMGVPSRDSEDKADLSLVERIRHAVAAAQDSALEKVASMLDVSAASLGSASTLARDYARDVTRDHSRRVRALKSKPSPVVEVVG